MFADIKEGGPRENLSSVLSELKSNTLIAQDYCYIVVKYLDIYLGI